MGVTRLEKNYGKIHHAILLGKSTISTGPWLFLSQTVDITRPGTLAYGILYWDAGILIQRLWLLLTPSK